MIRHTSGHASIDYGRLAHFRYELRRFLNFSQQAAEQNAIHPQQHQLLLVLAGAPEDQEVTVAYAADRMFLRHNSTVELVNRCVEQGLITRQEGSGDRRKSLLHLTPHGKRLLSRLAKHHLSELEEFGPRLTQVLSVLVPRSRVPRSRVTKSRVTKSRVSKSGVGKSGNGARTKRTGEQAAKAAPRKTLQNRAFSR